MPKRKCDHSIVTPRCRACAALQKAWYAKLKRKGFEDIEYGRADAKFLAGVHDVDPFKVTAANEFYDRVWQVFHLWTYEGRSKRDCRIAELFAQQDGTGTVRGISKILKREKLSPHSTRDVQVTLKEIKSAQLTAHEELNTGAPNGEHLEASLKFFTQRQEWLNRKK